MRVRLGFPQLLQLTRADQMQKIFLAIAFNALIRVGRAVQGTALGPASLFSARVSRLVSRTRLEHLFGADLGTLWRRLIRSRA